MNVAGNMLQHVSGIIDRVLIGVAVAAIIIVVMLIRRQTGRLAVRAEAAYPGPLRSTARRRHLQLVTPAS